MDDLQKAIAALKAGGITCALWGPTGSYTSSQRGVRPLLELLDSGADTVGFSAADKVVGKATAMLYVLLGVRAVYAGVISQSAVRVLEDHGISCSWDALVPYVKNRAGTGRCPMETATADIQDPPAALTAIRATLKNLSRQ